MDWIEQWFGVAPDNGEGWLEFLIYVVVGLIVAFVVLWRIPRARAALTRAFAELRGLIEGPRRG
jgi:hypothetical protein